MADFFAGLARLTVRLVLLLIGMAFAAFLLLIVLALAGLWALRAVWARLTGRPVSPWVMRVNPQDGWRRFYRAPGHAGQPGGAAQGAPTAGVLRPEIGDVTDVEVKKPRA